MSTTVTTEGTKPLTVERAEQLIRLLTDGLINIVDETGQFLLPLPDGTLVDTKGWKGWEWTHGVATTALYLHASLHPEEASGQYSKKVCMDWFEHQYAVTKGKGVHKNINTMSPFFALMGFAESPNKESQDRRWVDWCDEWAEWISKDLPRTLEGGWQHITYVAEHKNQLWDDTLVMTGLPMAKIGMALDRPEYIQEAKFQFLLHAQYLVDTTTGLWFHGWQFDGKSGHNFARALWARGNCWITIAIPMFIETLGDKYMPEHDPTYRMLKSAWRRQVDALVEHQDKETGLWHTLLVDPTSYVETSASAGFVAGIFAGIRMGLIPSEGYLDTAMKGLQGVIAQIDETGEVANVSFGTAMGPNLQFYKDIPITSMPYGQALAMLALVEWSRWQKASESSV